MKLVTQKYINGINGIAKKTAKITYDDNGTTKVLTGDDLISTNLNQNTSLLNAAMKELEFVSIENIPLETNINFKYGVYTTNDYEYVDYGNFIVFSCEKEENSQFYKIIAYDNMLKAKVIYTTLQNGTFPMTVRSYINNLCTDLGLTFADASNTFANYDKIIYTDVYANLGYNYFDIFNELAQVTASNIIINDENKLSIKYIDIEHKNKLNIYDGFDLGYINAQNVYVPDVKNALFKQKIPVTASTKYTFSVSQTIDNMVVTVYDANDNFVTRSKSSNIKNKTYTMPNNASYVRLAINYNNSSTMTEEIILSLKPMVEIGNTRTSYVSYVPTIDEDYLKSYNVSTKEIYGPVNTIVLTRSAGSDSVYYPSTLPENPYELKIEDNQIMNFNDRSEYLPDIYAKLNGLSFYTNDYDTYGISYLELADLYNLKVNNTIYSCLMLNTELKVTDGTEEKVYTPMPDTSSTKYDMASADDRQKRKTTLIVDKQNGTIQGIVSEIGDRTQKTTTITEDIDGLSSKVEMVVDITKEEESYYGQITIENVMSSEILELKVKPITNSISYMYPRNTLYPSNTLYSPNRRIRFTNLNTNDYFDYELPDDLLFYDDNNYDEFTLNYTDKICQVLKKCKYNANGEVELLATPTTLTFDYPSITLSNGNYTISILGHNQGYIKAKVVLQNDFTSQMATKVEMNSEISQTAQEINLEVSKKVGNNEVISKINQSAEQITIQANKLNLQGYITATDLSGSGTTTINGSNITTGTISADRISGGTITGASFNVTGANSIIVYGTDNLKDAELNRYGLYTYNDNGVYAGKVTATNVTYSGSIYPGISLVSPNNEKGFMTFDYGSQVVGDLNVTGNITQGSLEELKKNITLYKENAIEKVINSNIYLFNYKTEKNEDKQHIGFIIGDKYNTPNEIIKNNGIELYSMCSILWKAVQEQQEEIEQLKKEMEEIKCKK